MKKIGLSVLMVIILPTLLFAQGIEFRSCSFEQALAAAKEEGKLVFIDFYASWCGPCKKMANEVFVLKEVGEFFNQKFVNLKIDGEKGEGQALVRKYRVAAYPTFVVLNAEGTEVFRIVGGRSAEEFVERIRKGTDPDWSPEGLKRRYEGGERTSQLVNDYALMQLESGNRVEGEKAIQEYFEQLSDAERVAPENFFLFSKYALSYKDPKADYVFAHKDAFIQNNEKEKVEELLYKWLRQEMMPLVIVKEFPLGSEKVATLQKMEQKIPNAGMENNPSMSSLLKLAQICREGDIKKYMAACQKDFSKIDAQSKFYILLNFGYLHDGDKKIKEKAVKMINQQLEHLEPINRRVLNRVVDQLTSQE